MKSVRIILWGFVVIVAAIASYTIIDRNTKPAVIAQAAKPLGGPFNLINHHGKPITQDDLLGRNHAIFFGFTNCPDVCPTTLLQAASWLKELGSESDKLDFYFFTVDPGHDTPEIMNSYVTAFDPRITGVTGGNKEMDQAIKAYKIYANRVDLGEGDYTMDHSATVLMFRPDGSLEGTISFTENDDIALEKLRRLIKNT